MFSRAKQLCCSIASLRKKLLSGDFDLGGEDSLRKVSPLGKDLLSRMLRTNPESRLTAQEALDHGWF